MEKKTVHYHKSRGILIYGEHAYLNPIDHPGALVSNTREVRTSPIVSYDPITGRLETQNTIYMPR